MTLRFTLAFILLLCSSGFGLAACINHLAMVEAVNAKLPPTDQFGQLWWGPLKRLRLDREYRRLYPDGPLVRREGVLAAMILICLVLVGALIGLGFLVVVFGGVGGLFLWFDYFRKSPA